MAPADAAALDAGAAFQANDAAFQANDAAAAAAAAAASAGFARPLGDGFPASKLPRIRGDAHILPVSIPLKPPAIAPSPAVLAAAAEHRTVAISELYSHAPVLVLVLRRPGCPICRHWTSLLSAHRELISSYGIQLVTVIKESIGLEEFAEKYWQDSIFVDTEHHMYKFLNDGELHTTSIFEMMVSPTFWGSVNRANRAGFTGDFVGEGFILGGVMILSQYGEVVFKHTESTPGDYPSIESVLDACVAVSSMNAGQESSPVFLQMGDNRIQIA